MRTTPDETPAHGMTPMRAAHILQSKAHAGTFRDSDGIDGVLFYLRERAKQDWRISIVEQISEPIEAGELQ